MMDPARLLKQYRVEGLVAAYAFAYLALLALVGPGEEGLLWSLDTSLFFVIGGVTSGTLVVAAVRTADLRRRFAWFAFAASSAALWAGGISWTTLMATHSGETSAIAPVLIELGYVPLALLGFILLATDPRAPRGDPRLRFDALVFALGGLALTWHFDLRPFLANPEEFTQYGLFTIVGEWAVAVAASLAFLRATDRATRDAVGLLLAGHLAFILSDYFYSLSPDAYAPGAWVDAVWFAAWMFRWAAAQRLVRAFSAAGPPSEPIGESRDRGGVASSLFLIVTYVLLLMALLIDEAGGAFDIALATTAMTALLVGRQQFALAEYRRVARATAQQAARFRALAASATDLVLVVDEQLRVVFASPSVERLSGAIEGATFEPLLHPDDRVGIGAALVERAARGTARPYRCRMRDGDSAWRDVEFRVQDRRTDPLVAGFVLNGRDITSELALEGQLGHARKLATLSEMAGRIAHAFNNALAVIQGHTELVSEHLPERSPAREDVRAIRAAAERGAGITRQLLGFSGRQVIRPELLRPREVIEALLPMLRRLVPRRVVISLDEGDTSYFVRLDRAQFEQVLVNLVANARDGMPAGGHLRIAVGDDGAMVVVRVSDEGVGIPAAIRDRIFEPFFTTKMPGHGTGLGLAMVDSIARRAGGSITFETEVGRGTTFILSVPAILSGRQTPSSVDAVSFAVPRSTVVLLVDDDPAVLGASKRLLTRFGFRVLEAKDGHAALRIADDPVHRIDVLVTDLMMPGLSGREVIERFRIVRPGTPIICVTGFAAEREQDASLAPRVHAIVAKPFAAETLRRAILQAISGATSPVDG